MTSFGIWSMRSEINRMSGKADSNGEESLSC